jgi:hypothetical protein
MRGRILLRRLWSGWAESLFDGAVRADGRGALLVAADVCLLASPHCSLREVVGGDPRKEFDAESPPRRPLGLDQLLRATRVGSI